MMNYTKWNDPKTYGRMTADLAAYAVPENPILQQERMSVLSIHTCSTA